MNKYVKWGLCAVTVAGVAFLLFGPRPAKAQGFVDEPTCYSWSGGHKSAGSFSKCGPELQALAKKPVPPAPTPVVVAPAPVVQAVPPPVVLCQTYVPEVKPNKPVFIKKRPPKPKQVCK